MEKNAIDSASSSTSSASSATTVVSLSTKPRRKRGRKGRKRRSPTSRRPPSGRAPTNPATRQRSQSRAPAPGPSPGPGLAGLTASAWLSQSATVPAQQAQTNSNSDSFTTKLNKLKIPITDKSNEPWARKTFGDDNVVVFNTLVNTHDRSAACRYAAVLSVIKRVSRGLDRAPIIGLAQPSLRKRPPPAFRRLNIATTGSFDAILLCDAYKHEHYETARRMAVKARCDIYNVTRPYQNRLGLEAPDGTSYYTDFDMLWASVDSQTTIEPTPHPRHLYKELQEFGFERHGLAPDHVDSICVDHFHIRGDHLPYNWDCLTAGSYRTVPWLWHRYLRVITEGAVPPRRVWLDATIMQALSKLMDRTRTTNSFHTAAALKRKFVKSHHVYFSTFGEPAELEYARQVQDALDVMAARTYGSASAWGNYGWYTNFTELAKGPRSYPAWFPLLAVLGWGMISPLVSDLGFSPPVAGVACAVVEETMKGSITETKWLLPAVEIIQGIATGDCTGGVINLCCSLVSLFNPTLALGFHGMWNAAASSQATLGFAWRNRTRSELQINDVTFTAGNELVMAVNEHGASAGATWSFLDCYGHIGAGFDFLRSKFVYNFSLDLGKLIPTGLQFMLQWLDTLRRCVVEYYDVCFRPWLAGLTIVGNPATFKLRSPVCYAAGFVLSFALAKTPPTDELYEFRQQCRAGIDIDSLPSRELEVGIYDVAREPSQLPGASNADHCLIVDHLSGFQAYRDSEAYAGADWHMFWGSPLGMMPGRSEQDVMVALSRLSVEPIMSTRDQAEAWDVVADNWRSTRLTGHSARVKAEFDLRYDTALTVSEYKAHLREENPRNAADIIATIDDGTFVDPPTTTQMHVKMDEKQIRFKDIDGYLQMQVKPRPIHAVDQRVLGNVGPNLYHAQKLLKALWDGSTYCYVRESPVRVYYGARAMDQLGPLLQEFERSRSIGYFIVIQGDDSTIAYKSGAYSDLVFYEGDFSNYDASQSRGPLSAQRYFMSTELEVPTHTVESLAQVARVPLSVSSRDPQSRQKWLDVVLREHRDTGGADTSSGNSIVTFLSWLFVLNMSEDPYQFEHWFTEIGLTLKLKRVSGRVRLTWDEVTFLKGWFVLTTNNERRWAPLPSRLLKIGYFKTNWRLLYKDRDLGTNPQRSAMEFRMAEAYKQLAPFCDTEHTSGDPLLTVLDRWAGIESPRADPLMYATWEYTAPIDYDLSHYVEQFSLRYGVSYDQTQAFINALRRLELGTILIDRMWFSLALADY